MFILLIVSTVGIAMILYEYSRPGRNWPAVRGWWLRAILFNSFQVFSVWFAGVAWDGWLVRHRFFSLARLGTYGEALLGYFATTFVFYWWHRWRHASPFLWRWVHQIHHSPQRLEVITSFYKHPFEILLDSLIMSVILYLGVGVEPVAAAGAVTLSGLAELMYHWNVKTPHWLGYIFQRPESHCIHHQERVHAFNYSDLPMWDMLFGTYRNPREWDGRCGFGPEREFRVSEMLRGIDLHQADASKVESTGRTIAIGVLALLGFAQMAGDIFRSPTLKAIAAATAASPAPKVFSAVRGLETFSTRFFVEWCDATDAYHSVEITPERYAHLRGPYNRRNVYGAVLAYGPVLESDPRTFPLFHAVSSYALCGEAPLLRELGIPPDAATESLRIRLQTRPQAVKTDLPLILGPHCS